MPRTPPDVTGKTEPLKEKRPALLPTGRSPSALLNPLWGVVGSSDTPGRGSVTNQRGPVGYDELHVVVIPSHRWWRPISLQMSLASRGTSTH